MELIDQLDIKFNDLEKQYDECKNKKGRLVLRARQLETNNNMIQIVQNEKEESQNYLDALDKHLEELEGRKVLIKDEVDEEIKSK